MPLQDQVRPSPDKLTLLTIGEAIERLKIGRSKFYLEVAAGKIRLRKVGNASRVRSDELDVYIESLPSLSDKEADGE